MVDVEKSAGADDFQRRFDAWREHERKAAIYYPTVVIVLLLLVGCAAALEARQDRAMAAASSNGTPVIVLSRELELEEQLQIARDERDIAISRAEQLQMEKQQLSAVVERLIGDALSEVQQPRAQKAAEARDAVARKLVAAMKGDWEKRDRWDWQRRGMVRADGTFVPLDKDKK
jgi:hypothetical protein